MPAQAGIQTTKDKKFKNDLINKRRKKAPPLQERL